VEGPQLRKKPIGKAGRELGFFSIRYVSRKALRDLAAKAKLSD
jgi:hypothetical protein